MKRNNYLLLISTFLFLFVFFLLKYNFDYNLSSIYLNMINSQKIDTSMYIYNVLTNTIFVYLIFIVIYFMLKFFFNRYVVKINFKKLKKEITINDYLNKTNRVICLTMIFVSMILVVYNFDDLHLKNKSLNEIETKYFTKLNNLDLTTTNSDNYLIKNNVYAFPNPKEIITFDIDTLDNKLEDVELNTIITINVDNKLLTAFGIIKVQGSSTAHWPKKNWSLKLFKDELREEELKIKIGDSVFSNKWILKADWIDPTMLRNGVSYTLWDDMVDSREDGFLEVNKSSISFLGAKGSPRYYTGVTNINGEHYGIATVLLGHDVRNFNIDKDNDSHLYFEFDGRGGSIPGTVWDKFKADGIGETISFYNIEDDEVSRKQKEAIDNLGKFINSDISIFKKDFDKHLDKRNLIDMLLFYEMIYDWDAVAQDLEIVTYDLEKFYFLPWDKDTAFGMWWEGNKIVEDSKTETVIDYISIKRPQKPWYKTYHLFTEDVETRYKELRDKDVFTVNNLINKIDPIYSKISNDVWEKEYARWPDRPATDITDKDQIIDWFENRLELLDKQFNY